MPPKKRESPETVTVTFRRRHGVELKQPITVTFKKKKKAPGTKEDTEARMEALGMPPEMIKIATRFRPTRRTRQ